MILGFMQKFPWGTPTFFKSKIEAGQKIHTIRAGQRWQAGDFIHMATGVRTKQYNQFNENLPALQRVKSVQRIDIIHRGPGCALIFIDRNLFYSRIETEQTIKEFHPAEFLELIRNDGLDSEDQFWKWFAWPLRNGQIIHWTDFKY